MSDLHGEYIELRKKLDKLRQQDNRILFDLGNPPEMDAERGEILSQMRSIVGKMQEIERKQKETPDDPADR